MHTLPSFLGVMAVAGLTIIAGCAPAVSPETRVHRMGERVTVGSLVYNVFEDQWKAKLGEGADTRVPKDRFFLLRLSVANGGATELMVPTLTLLDDSGQTYTELSNGEQVPQWTGFLRRVKPAETLQGFVAFDVAPRHYRLRVSDENSQKAREIDIPLNFTSDTPDMMNPQ
ncbi:MAG TPA: DUF4352 domain-containing protein [Bryobacteraceae bacterium]|nr:DUF4352 domain-containing protein [Bryobacteraceae bacterium]